jgi:hypothetical protein
MPPGRRRFGGTPGGGESEAAPRPESVFISYSHEDVKFFEMLMRHLKVIENQHLIRIFAHDTLRPGARWQEAARSEIAQAAAAILLVTPDYLASPAIMADEIPRLLARAEEHGAAILPLLVKPSLIGSVPQLYRFKAFNPTDKTLIEMRPGEKERFLVSVAEAVQEVVLDRRTGRGGDLLL